jgi:hypothetical protein
LLKEAIMSVNKRLALVASVVALATSPIAMAHGPMKFGTSTTPLSVTEPQMQAQASEAPAWHSGDGSIYDSSQGQIIASAPLGVASNATPAETPNTAASAEGRKEVAVPSPTTTMERDAPAASVGSGRQTANPGRYAYRPK